MASKKSGNSTSANQQSKSHSSYSHSSKSSVSVQPKEAPTEIEEIELAADQEENTPTLFVLEEEVGEIAEAEAAPAPEAKAPLSAPQASPTREIDWQKVRTAIHAAGWDTTLHNGDFDKVWQIAKERGAAGVAGISWLGGRTKYAKLVEDLTK